MRAWRWAALLALAITCLWVRPAKAVTAWYFSDCAGAGHTTGCWDNATIGSCVSPGTITNPFCPDVNGDGAVELWMYLFDGAGTEAADGDDIWTCAGACNGSGSGTIHPNCTDKTVSDFGGGASNFWFWPDLNASTGITVGGYPGEDVTLDGDLNDNGSFDGTRNDCAGTDDDLTNFISNYDKDGNSTTRNYGGYTVKHIKFKRVGDSVFWQNGDGGTPAAGDWTFDDVVMSEVGSAAWGNTTGVGAVDCSPQRYGVFAIFRWDTSGNLTVKNSTIHTVCGMGIRNIASANVTGTPLQLFDNVEAYNIYQVGNDWGVWNWKTNKGIAVTYRRLYAHDFYQGLGFENRGSDITVEDSTFACLGAYDVSSNQGYDSPAAHFCNYAIRVGIDDNDPANTNGTTTNFTIRRCKIYGTRIDSESNTVDGGLNGAIRIRNDCRDVSLCTGTNAPWEGCTGSGTGTVNSGSTHTNYGCVYGGGPYTALVENNMIFQLALVPGAFSARAFTNGGISIAGNMPVTFRNNTGYDMEYALQIHDGGGGPSGTTAAHDIRDNLLANCYGTSSAGCIYLSEALSPAPTFTNNNAYRTSNATVYVISGGTTESCTTWGAHATSNKCAAPSLAVCDSGTYCASTNADETTWDMHLSGSDTADKDAGASGAAEDYDGDTRPQNGTTDIGADEVVAGGGGTPSQVIHVSRNEPPGPPMMCP